MMAALEETTKICTKCGYGKPTDKFGNQPMAKNGLSSWCKECISKQVKEYYQGHKVEAAEYKRVHKVRYDKYRQKYKQTLRGHINSRFHDIKERCNNPRHPKYKYYGSRGIKLRFTFNELYDWCVTNHVNPRGLEVHRIDNNGHYELDNIEFITPKEHGSKHKE